MYWQSQPFSQTLSAQRFILAHAVDADAIDACDAQPRLAFRAIGRAMVFSSTRHFRN
jgi:hypothetical protein